MFNVFFFLFLYLIFVFFLFSNHQNYSNKKSDVIYCVKQMFISSAYYYEQQNDQKKKKIIVFVNISKTHVFKYKSFLQLFVLFSSDFLSLPNSSSSMLFISFCHAWFPHNIHIFLQVCINMSINGVFFFFFLLLLFSLSFFLRVISYVCLWLNAHINQKKKPHLSFFFLLLRKHSNRQSFVCNITLNRQICLTKKNEDGEREQNLYCPRLDECIQRESTKFFLLRIGRQIV